MMWVNSREFKRLQQDFEDNRREYWELRLKMAELESELKVTVADYEHVHIGDAVLALAKHLGVNFEEVPAQPNSVKVVELSDKNKV